MPSVPTITSTSPSSPASATAPRPPGPSVPVPCASSTITRTSWWRASSTISSSGATSPSIENTPSVTISAAAAVGVAQAPLEVVDVRVAVDERLRARQPAAVDDRGVVELVGEDDLAAPRERRHDAEVRQVAGAEQQRALRPLERREPLLEPPVQRHVARHEPRRPRARAPAHRRVRRRLAHARVVGEAEVVVRAEQQDGLAVEDHARPLRTAHHAHAAIQAERFELVQSVLQIQHVAPVYAADGSPRLGAPSGLGGTEDFLR